MQQKLVIVQSSDQLSQIFSIIDNSEYISFDVETTGLHKDSKIVGFSIAADEDVGYYVILSKWNKNEQRLINTDISIELIKKILTGLQQNKKLITHNGLFDAWLSKNNFNEHLMPYIHTDTMLLAHLLDENRSAKLKDLAFSILGEDATVEQREMKASVIANGGVWQEGPKGNKEMYKADPEVLARYGAKDAILTMRLFYNMIPKLFEEKLDQFFYEETMPLYRGPTYDLNTTGLKVDNERLIHIKQQLETEILEAKSFIYSEIATKVSDKYAGLNKKNTFNIASGPQLAWLLFFQLNNEFGKLTDKGKDICKFLGIKPPYSMGAKRSFISSVTQNIGQIYEPARINPKTKKLGRPKKVREPWYYIKCDKNELKRFEKKYKWVEKLLQYKKNEKILGTYVLGIQSKVQYGIIRPSFGQSSTVGNRYSSYNPNFQNLPRNDKRVKSFLIARPGKVFIGADYDQLEPRVFAFYSQDERLMNCFSTGDDFYSVVGIETFDRYDCIPRKEGDPNAFGVKFPRLRDISKVVALSSVYGTLAFKLAPTIEKSVADAQDIIDRFFYKFPKLKQLQLDSHKRVMEQGFVTNYFGRPRRLPEALNIKRLFGNSDHADLPYEYRKFLNSAVNSPIQMTAGSIINRASIAFKNKCKELSKTDSLWSEVFIVMQVHDELIVESPEAIKHEVVRELQDAMENTTQLPGVKLTAKPKIAYDISQLK